MPLQRFSIFLQHTGQGLQNQVLPNYISNLDTLVMIPLNLLFFHISSLSYLDLSMKLNPATNIGSNTHHWKSTRLLSVVGYSCMLQFLWEWPFQFYRIYFVMGLINNAVTNSLVKENDQNDLLFIASATPRKLTLWI